MVTDLAVHLRLCMFITGFCIGDFKSVGFHFYTHVYNEMDNKPAISGHLAIACLHALMS